MSVTSSSMRSERLVRSSGIPRWSSFEEQHGFSIDGVDLETAVLAEGWRERLVKVQNANTAAVNWLSSRG